MLLDSSTQTLTAALRGQIARQLGIEEIALDEGIRNAAALVIAALSNLAASGAGAEDILAPSQSGADAPENVLAAVESGHSDALLDRLFGVGLTKVTQWIRDTTGQDTAPFLPYAAPLVLHSLRDAVDEQKLDGPGLASFLQTENDAFARANPQLASAIRVALDTGENVNARAAQIRARFTDEEWNTLNNVPSLASYAVMVSDWSGPRGLTREMNALLEMLSETAAHDDADTLVGLVSRNVTSPDSLDAMGIHRDNAMPMTRDAALDALAILQEKATFEETAAYKKFVIEAATRVAQAANDGGVLGIGGKPVSAQEQTTLDLIAAALAYEP